MYSKYHIKKKTNEFFNKKNKDWINRTYLFDEGILFRVFDRGIVIDSLNDTENIYALACKYIEFLFFNTTISIYGMYDMNKLLRVKGVRISEI